jgi:ribosomal-protein-alanine N-acetyltransferase
LKRFLQQLWGTMTPPPTPAVRRWSEYPVLVGERVLLRLADFDDIGGVLEYYTRNEEHLTPWEPTKPPLFYQEVYWQVQIGNNREEFRNDRSLRLFMFMKNAPRVVEGVVNFSNFSRGVFQCCTLGYGLSRRCEGKGLMQEALSLAVNYVLFDLNFHRIQANYMPRNRRSGELLKRLGFRVEGYAYDYLVINDRWEDHVLTSLTHPHWKKTL